MNIVALTLRHKLPNFKCLSTFSDVTSLETSLVSQLKSISSAPSSLISHGQQLHAFILKHGLGSNIFIQNSLITMYSKMGFLSSARSLFENSMKLDTVSCNIMLGGYVRNGRLSNAYELFAKMPVRNCVSYTTVILALSQSGDYCNAISVFREMMLCGVVPNEVTMGSVLSAYARVGCVWSTAASLHCLVLKIALDVPVLVATNVVNLYCVGLRLSVARAFFDEMLEKNVVSWNVMLNGYVKAGFVDLGRELFEKIPEKDVVSWGTMVDGYVQAGKLRDALDLYSRMVDTGVSPNEVLVVDLISACGQATKFYEGRQLHCSAVKMGFIRSDFMQTTLIYLYAACDEIELARLQFEEANKGHVASWNAFLTGLIRNGMIDEARYLFDEMPERDVFSWSSMITGYSQNGQANLTLELFRGMVADGVRPNEVTMVGVLSAIASLGILKEGRWAHDYILSNSIPFNDNLSAALIDMYSKCGSIDSALEVFFQVRDETKEVSPWNAIICGLAMHGHAQVSLRIFSDLQTRNIKLNSITFIGVLTACCHAGLVETGEKYFKTMKSTHGIQPSIKHYGCMVDILGRAGRLKEAEELIESMPMKADVVIWGALLAACKMHQNTDIGERAAQNLASVDSSHGPSRVLLSNIFADAGRWDDALLVRKVVQSGKLSRSHGYSGVGVT